MAAIEKQRLEENRVSATRIIEENRRIGLNDPRRFIDANGNLKPVGEWTRRDGRGRVEKSKSSRRTPRPATATATVVRALVLEQEPGAGHAVQAPRTVTARHRPEARADLRDQLFAGIVARSRD